MPKLKQPVIESENKEVKQEVPEEKKIPVVKKRMSTTGAGIIRRGLRF